MSIGNTKSAKPTQKAQRTILIDLCFLRLFLCAFCVPCLHHPLNLMPCADAPRTVSREVKMKAMILAAGFGTRLWPLTVGRTKPALPFLNRPLIAYTIEYLKRHGVED